jgi:hypothetical protein
MRDSWLKLVDGVLRPARARRERCLVERERHLEARRVFAERRAQTIARCEARIEAARAEVFAANDGVVTARMTQLEREWRRLSRSDPDAGLMDLWASVAPRSWIDQKRWREFDRATQVDGAIALAADADGVDAAEAAARGLRSALAAWGTNVGARVRWRWLADDFEGTTDLLAAPLRAAGEVRRSVLDRARHLEREVHEAALARFPERVVLARALAHAAYVDGIYRAASANPVTPLRALWTTGYVLSAVDSSGVTLAMPPLFCQA